MKTKSLCVAMALLCLACNRTPETNADTDTKNLEILNCEISSEPMAIKEKVHYAPPVIKEDAIQGSENTRSSNGKNKKIIKDGYLSIEVADVEHSKRCMDSVITKFDAYYENEDLRNKEDLSYYNLKIRVPYKQFEAFLKATENGSGIIAEKNIQTRDVTEDYYDSEIRLGSKRLFRNRYNELLTKAIKVDDILAIEENLRVVQEEIESQEGHLKFIDDQVLFSTLTVHLFHSKEIVVEKAEETFAQRMGHSFGNGWNSIISFLLWVLSQWPWIIVLAVISVISKRWLKRRKKMAV